MDEVTEERQDAAGGVVGPLASGEVFTVGFYQTAVLPRLVFHSAEIGFRQVDGPSAVGAAVGVAPACEYLAGEVAGDGAAGMTVAHLDDKRGVGAVSFSVARRLVAVDAVMAALEVVDIQQLTDATALMMKLPTAVLAVVPVGAADIVGCRAVRRVEILAEVIEAAFVYTFIGVFVVIIVRLAVKILAGIVLAPVRHLAPERKTYEFF